MKKRKLISDIFTIVLMCSIVLVLLAYLNVFKGGSYDEKGSTAYIICAVAMPLALASVAIIDLVLPIIDNKSRFSENKFKIRVIVKCVLFVLSIVALGLHLFNLLKLGDFVEIAIFCVIYFVQFLINLDSGKNEPEEEEEEEDEEAELADDEAIEESDDAESVHSDDDDDEE